jgi:hypothetical protein
LEVSEVVRRELRDCIDPVLNGDMAGGRKAGDPMSERVTKSPSASAGKARLIHLYRSASSAS